MVQVDNPGTAATAPPEQYYGKPPPPPTAAPEMGVPFQPPQQAVPVGLSSLQALQANHTAPGTWSTGLCDCFSDVSNCCITCWCPCVTFGQIAEIVDQGSTSCGASGALYALIAYVTGCACVYSCFYRSKMRRHFMLPEHPLPDCIVHFFCESCALCQEYRELQNRGIDVSLGWHGNIARQQQNQRMQMDAPFVQGGMMR